MLTCIDAGIILDRACIYCHLGYDNNSYGVQVQVLDSSLLCSRIAVKSLRIKSTDHESHPIFVQSLLASHSNHCIHISV